MARIAIPLTDTQIKQAKPQDKDFLLSDGYGLQLRVKPNGSKHWFFAYSRPADKKRTVISLGRYPDLSLALARKQAANQREILAQGIDPQSHRKEQEKIQVALKENSVFKVAEKWFEIKRHTVSDKHAFDTWRLLEMYIFPYIGNESISSITAPQVIDVLRPIEASGKLFVTGKVVQRINAVMNYAVNAGLVHANPLSGIGAAFKSPEKKNQPTLKPEEITELLSSVAVSNIQLTTKLLINWQLHTMVRPSEAAGTRWDEFDFENKVWIIPAERMKGQKTKKREHRVPLTQQMLEILEIMKPISSHHDYVFPADRNPKNHINAGTANTALKRLGFQNRTTAHGLRSLASTTLNDQGFASDLIETALSHVDKNQVRSAYNRSDYLERRREMMQWWSSHIEGENNIKIASLRRYYTK